MTTPLIILAILVLPLAIARLSATRSGARIDARLGGVVGLSMSFVFFGVGHFAQTQPMSEMLPAWVPMRVPLIYVTGLLEWGLAAALLTHRYRRLAGWACIAVLVLFFPANIYAALNSVGMGGHQWGPVYLLIRAPLQLILIGWTYWFTLRKASP